MKNCYSIFDVLSYLVNKEHFSISMVFSFFMDQHDCVSIYRKLWVQTLHICQDSALGTVIVKFHPNMELAFAPTTFLFVLFICSKFSNSRYLVIMKSIDLLTVN